MPKTGAAGAPNGPVEDPLKPPEPGEPMGLGVGMPNRPTCGLEPGDTLRLPTFFPPNMLDPPPPEPNMLIGWTRSQSLEISETQYRLYSYGILILLHNAVGADSSAV